MAAQQTAKSLHDIASLIRQPATPAAPTEVVKEDTLVEGNIDDTDQIEEGADEADLEDDHDEGEDAPEYETSEEGEDEEEDAGDDDADEPTADEDGFFAVADDDMIEVKIDGETVLRSIADAKKALSGEGAIEKRLKEATERRKQAQADHTMLLEQFSTAHKSLMKTVEGMETIVFKPLVQKPDPALRQSDPQKYLLQVDAYEADQKRVENGKKAIRELIEHQQKALEKDIGQYREHQTSALLEAIPELADQERAPVLLKAMSKLAMERYGYSAEEIQQASDHRMYRMMHDLAKFYAAREPATRKANTMKNLEGQAAKRPRKLRSGATALKAKARKQADAQKQAADKARQTGKIKDVAATLIKRG